jgi:O-antigen ligase
VSVLNLLEKGFVILSFLLFTGAVSPIVSESYGISPDEPDPITRVLYVGIFVGTIILIIVWHKRVFHIVLKEKLLWALIGIVLGSVFWSTNPGETLRNLVTFVRSTLFGIYFGARYSLNEQLRLLAWILGTAALLSVVFALVPPHYGIMGIGANTTPEAMSHAGAWRGIYIHKNGLGRMMVLSALVFLLFAMSSRRYRWVLWAGFCLSVGLIVLSTSKTSLVLFAVLIALLPFYQALRWNYTLAVPFFITVIFVGGGAATLLITNADTILHAFGRDSTLTGRTELWAAVLDKIWEHPWLGYGYAGFWRGLNGGSGDVWSIVGWEAPHSHNGFLDLTLDLGLLGLSTFALSVIVVCLRAVTWIRLTKTAENLWPMVYLAFFLLANLTESSLFRQKPMWLLYVAITFSIHIRRSNFVDIS